MSLFARGNRRKQQEPPSSVDFGYTRRRKPIDPPCTLKREEKEPKIELSEHQLELRKQKSRDSDNYQENSCTQTSDHGAPILYDDEGEIVLDENAIGPRVYGTEDVIRTERSVTKETKSSSAPSRALSHAVTMEPATKAKAAPRQSSNQDIQRPFMTRSNQAKTEPKQAEPARTHTSSKNIALASLMSRSAARGPVSKRNSKQTSTENGTNKVNESTQPSKSNHTKLGSLSTVSSSTSASEEQKAVLRQMLGNTTIDKHSHGTRPSGKAKSLSTSNSSSASNSTFDSNVRKSEPPSDTGKEILRGYMKKVAHQSSSRLAFTVGHENNYVKSRDKEETKSASKAVYDTVVESEADASIVIQKKKSGSFDEASVQSGRSGSNKSKTTTSSSGKNALLQKVLARTISKATSNKDGERESPRGKLNPRTKHLKMASGSPRSDAESSLVISKASESVSDSKSSKDSRLESAAVSLSQKVLKSSSKSFSPKGRGLKGIFKNRIGRSKKQDTVQKSNPITEPSENTLAKASSADSGNTLNGGVSFRSVDETVDETLDSTVDSSYKGSQKQKVTNSQLATTSYESEEARPTLGASSTLSENSGNASFGPAPYVSKAYEGSKNIVASATTDTEESSAIMVNLQSASIDSMQYSTEESYDEDLYLSKTQPSTSSESQRGPNHSLLVKPSQQDAEPKGYVDFVEALRAEASGAHLQLWASFHAAISGSGRRIPPKQERGSHFRFDPATKKMLAEMNAHLKKQGSVECVTATQLVNDKKYAKETAVGLALRTAKAESIDACSISKANAPTTCSSSSQSVHDNLPCLREMKPLVDGDDSTPANKIDFSGEIQEPLGISESTSSVESTLGQYESQATAQAPEEKKSDPASDGIQPMKTTSAARAAQGKISMGKKRVQQPHTLPVPEEEPALPWVGVRLRSVAPGKGDDTESSNNSQSEEPCMPSPWAKVKLRRVSAANEDHKGNVEGGESTQVDVEGAGQQTCSEPEIIVCPSHLSDLEDKTKAKSDEPELIECPTNLSDLDDGPTVAEEKASNQSSTEACMQENSSEAEIIGREKIDESAIVFPLKQSSSISEDKQEKVVIGKKMVMLLRSQPNQPDDRALVTWKYPREKIKALKLDMESQSVNLNLLEGGSQALSFHDSTDCLKFANAFYELLKPNDKRQADMINPSKSDDSSQHMEHLNQEEQKVLETYRQVRRNKPAGDAMRAIVHNPLLTDAEVKIAEKYRKMLKDSIPLNDVRARMQLEGVSVAVENFILSSVQGAAEHEADKCSKNLTSGTDLPLSEEERKAAEPYQKMLRLQIPPEAVQHKMTKEGIGPKIMGFVLGQAGVLAADTNYPEELSESECKIATLYSNMLKLMVPPHTVREKMKEDNVNEKIVFAVLGKDKVEKKTLEDTATKLSEAEEAIAASYRKMLKMMIPKEAVRHKMIKDQVDPKIMLVVVGGDKSAESDEVKLSDKEEAIAATYKKMLKLQLPKEAVQHRMEKEGVSEKIMKAVLGSKTSSSKKDSNTTSSTKTDNKKGGSNLVSLHWTPLSGEELDNSVWRASKKRKVTKAQPERSDISKLVELFQKKNNAKAIKAKTGDGSNSGTGKAKLLDINRANNIAISLKAFKDFSYEELAEILKNIDPNGKLKGERVLFVRDLLPTPAEVNVIKRYYGSPDRLVPAEMWFQRVAHIKRLEAKANVLRAMEVFDFEVAEIRESLQLLAQVCSQVMESERLRELLDMVLQIGNIMNEGTRTGGAAGFKFDSLLRLTQTKSADGKTTVLDYLVTIFAAKGQREVLNLTEDFPECQAASRMLITDLVANVRSIGDTLEKCKKEHQALVSELSGKVASASANYQGRNNKANQETASDTRLQLFAAIKSRGVEDPRKTTSEAPSRETSVQMKKGDILDAIKSKAADSSSKSNESKAPPVNDLLKALNKVNGSSECSVKSPRSNLLSSQNSKGSSIEANSDNSTPSHPSPLQQGVARLGKFIEEAEKNYKVLKLDCDGALNTCREMSKYCGESTGERATDTLLGILSEFVSNLEAAVKKHDRIVAAESKKQNKHQSGTPKKQRRRPEDLPVPARPSNEKLQLKEDSKEGGMNGQYAKASPRRKPSPKSKPSPESAAQTKALLPPPPPGKNGKSLVLMVNQLLKDADEQTKNDFCQGVVYEDADNTLKEIYEREKRAMARTGVPPLPTGRRGSVESDILTTIKKRQGETDANVARETRSQLERVIGCMNCTTNTTNRAESDADSVKTESSQLENSFKDLQKKWSQCKSKSSASIASVGSKRSDKNQDDEGSVHLPIDCTDFEDVVGLDQSESHGPNNLINSVVTFENGTLKSQDDDNKGSNTATSCSDESSGETKVESEPESDQK